MSPRLRFIGGPLGAAAPILVFVVWAVAISVAGAPSEQGLIFGMLFGLVVGMFLCRSAWSDYAEELFSGMANPIATVTIMAWFWAGMFAQLVRAGGLVDGLVWLGGVSNATGGSFVGATFVLAAVFASAVGTGYGTVVAFCTLMFPTGLILGADPVWLFAAILSGAAFGDNLAPVSDTTVVSATTQNTDIPGVVRNRFKYALIAAVPALILFVLFGGGEGSVDRAAANALFADSASPRGLILLIPFALVIGLALRGTHIIVTLTWGILAAIALQLGLGLSAPETILFLDPERDLVGGALVDGITGYVGLSILILLIVAGGHLMRIGGALEAIVSAMKRFAGESVSRAETAIWGWSSRSIPLSPSTPRPRSPLPPVVSELGEKFGLHPYRERTSWIRSPPRSAISFPGAAAF